MRKMSMTIPALALAGLMVLAGTGAIAGETPADSGVPASLEESFEALSQKLSPDDLETFRNKSEDALGEYHFGLGRWMRNEWGLWSGSSKLSEYFQAQGIDHPDDMSAIILTSFHRHLHNRPLKLREQIRHYQDYWEERKK